RGSSAVLFSRGGAAAVLVLPALVAVASVLSGPLSSGDSKTFYSLAPTLLAGSTVFAALEVMERGSWLVGLAPRFRGAARCAVRLDTHRLRDLAEHIRFHRRVLDGCPHARRRRHGRDIEPARADCGGESACGGRGRMRTRRDVHLPRRGVASRSVVATRNSDHDCVDRRRELV